MWPVSETDFKTQVLEAGVNVFFKPTKSHYTFLRLSNDKHVARSAPHCHAMQLFDTPDPAATPANMMRRRFLKSHIS